MADSFVVIGTGGVGGLIGGLLANAGHDVTFVARGKMAQAMRERGLQIKSLHGNFSIDKPNIVESCRELTGAATAFLSVKSGQLDGIGAELATNKNYGGAIVPLLNGVDAPDVLLKHLPLDRVLGGMCYMISEIESPGVIHHWAVPAAIHAGELDGKMTRRLESLCATLKKSGAEAVAHANIRSVMWEKLAFIVTYGTLCAAGRSGIGAVRETESGKQLIHAMVAEIIAVAKSCGISLPQDTASKVAARIFGLPPESTSSLMRDMMQGKPSELDWQLGAAVEKAMKAGLPCPAINAIYAILLPWERANRTKGSAQAA